MTTFRKGLLLGASVAAITLAATHTTSATENRSWYVSLFGGVSIPQSMDAATTYITAGVPAPGFTNDLELDAGFIVGGAIGTRLWDNVRGEIELAFRKSDGDTFNRGTPGGFAGTYVAAGDVTSLTLLANLWYDLDSVSPTRSIRPYLGGGIGIGLIDADLQQVGFPSFGFLDDATAFAFQLGTGVNWEFSDRATVGLGYRLRGLAGVDFTNPPVSFGPTTTIHDLDVVLTHNFIVNVIWDLN